MLLLWIFGAPIDLNIITQWIRHKLSSQKWIVQSYFLVELKQEISNVISNKHVGMMRFELWFYLFNKITLTIHPQCKLFSERYRTSLYNSKIWNTNFQAIVMGKKNKGRQNGCHRVLCYVKARALGASTLRTRPIVYLQ